ncbi:MAG: hypothetical protein RL684_1411 [Pseudomonadota bacterium]|jgi:hypothetical protein
MMSPHPNRRGLLAGAALLVVLRSGALWAAEPDDLQPGVQTSSAAVPVKPAAATQPAGKAAARTTTAPATPGAADAGAMPATRPAGAHDRVELDTTQITGNRELPNVMYVVPWKKPELGDFGGRPPKSLLDELLAPVDRDVFRRQNRYYSALKAGTAAGQGAQAGTDAGGGAAGNAPAAPATRNTVDEK